MASGDTRQLQQLPAVQRHELLSNTLQTLSSVCMTPAGEAVQSHCQQLAEVVISLDECQADCRSLAQRFIPHATR